MICPYCSHQCSRVTDKRKAPHGIRRRRECLSSKCKKRFTTYEVVEKNDLFITKKDGRREKFEKEKLSGGIEKAFEKRPISKELVEKIINDIEEQIRKMGKREIKSSIVGNLVMKKIKKYDGVAYVRFASIYKNFSDLGDFRKEIKEMNK